MTDNTRLPEIRERAITAATDLRKLLPEQVDYAGLVGAPAWAYWKERVWMEPEPYAIDAAAKSIDELLFEIDRLTAELAALKEAQRWIPVTERLPEIGKCVLIRQTYHAFSGERGEYESVTIGYLHQPTDRRCRPYFYYAAVSDYGDIVRAESICPGREFVTHWMPLPAPPEQLMDAQKGESHE